MQENIFDDYTHTYTYILRTFARAFHAFVCISRLIARDEAIKKELIPVSRGLNAAIPKSLMRL